MFITLDDERGIDIVSNKDISITADNNILLASSSIHISANTLSLSNEDNKITLEEANILIEGTEIKMN